MKTGHIKLNTMKEAIVYQRFFEELISFEISLSQDPYRV